MSAIEPVRATNRPAGEAPRRLLRGTRPLKAWRYAGLYTDSLMLCAGCARIAGVPQRFWAVWDRGAGKLHERTRVGGGLVELTDERVRVRDRRRGIEVDLALEPYGDSVEVRSPHGSSEIWTRKWLARATGEVRISGRRVEIGAPLLVDESAGYHARVTNWQWSAGFGTTVEGDDVAWNLVSGIHDAPSQSERTVWRNGSASEVAPVTFAADLSSVDRMEFASESTRARTERFGALHSDYEQPFGTFSGFLPDGSQLRTGFGVMERHEARW